MLYRRYCTGGMQLHRRYAHIQKVEVIQEVHGCTGLWLKMRCVATQEGMQ